MMRAAVIVLAVLLVALGGAAMWVIVDAVHPR